ncbi:Hint domain-containing protein [Pseudogemmobacter sp. W21_MBD1_M6]|uniref:Hint domain-containing protein n=1 Tax=Pseudogemmobacter sp. W21_MBD1_M6 TaxID=3240271 RepID=UPI003F9C2FEE
MATGYLVFLGNNVLNSNDPISTGSSEFSPTKLLGSGSWTYNYPYLVILTQTATEPGSYYLDAANNVYFVPNNPPASGFTSTKASAVPAADGTVTGTSSGEVMTTGYTGDHDGDTINNNANIIKAGDGNDTVMSQGGNDTVYGGAGNDTINGGDGNDTIDGGAGNDILNGDAGDDTIHGDQDPRVAFKWQTISDPNGGGGAGIDAGDPLSATQVQAVGGVNVTYSYNANPAGHPNGFGGTDTAPIYNAAQNYVANIDTGSDAVNPYSGMLFGGDDAASQIQLDFSTAVSNVAFRVNDIDANGTLFSDTVSVFAYDINGNPIPVSITFGSALAQSNTDGVAGNETGQATGVAYTDADAQASMLVNIAGPVGKIVIRYEDRGTTGDDGLVSVTDIYFDAPGGDDTIDGGTGNDTLFGDAGNDIIYGGATGTDAIYGGAGRDTIDGGTSADNIFGGTGSDTINLTGAFGNDVIQGGENVDNSDFDVINASTLTEGISVVYGTNPESGTLTGTTSSDTVTFSQIEDIIYTAQGDLADATSSTADVTINTGAGNDTLKGGTGNDTLIGGDGNDVLVGSVGADAMYGGAGQDTIDYSASSSAVQVNLSTNTLTGGDAANDTQAGIDGLIGSDFDDTLIGYDGQGADYTNIFYGGAGNDYLDGMGGDDQLYGGADNDTISGGVGDDYLYGGDGQDIFLLTEDHQTDTIQGGEGGVDFDVLNFSNWQTTDGITVTFNGNEAGSYAYDNAGATGTFTEIEGLYATGNTDVLDASVLTSSVVIDAGGGDDIVTLGSGADTLWAGAGADTIDAGGGDDVINLGDNGAGGTDGAADVMVLQNGDGNDTVYNFDVPTDNGNGTFAGIDTLNVAGILSADNSRPVNVHDVTVTGVGGDTLLTFPNGVSITLVDVDAGFVDNPFVLNAMGIPFSDGIVFGTAADDAIDATYTGDTDGDMVDAGDNIVAGSDPDEDIIYAGDGNDTVLSGAGDDIVFAGAGNDTLTGGIGADTLFGGDDDDTIYGLGNDTVDGGEGGTDNDSLFAYDVASHVQDPENSENGTITFKNGDVLTYTNIETVTAVPCFTPGTIIKTFKGEVAVETLQPGDRVLTRDHGFQPVRWVGQRDLGAADLVRHPELNPIRISAGALGNGLPLREMRVSPQHRMLVANERTQLWMGEDEVLAAAKHLTHVAGVDALTTLGVTYIHVMFDSHQIISADGCWTESFQPGDKTLEGMDAGQRRELLTIFPNLASREGRSAYQSARTSLKSHEVRLVI